MNGREIENLISAMDASIEDGRASLRQEILLYLFQHEETVLQQLRTAGKVRVPSAAGEFEISLPELEALVA